MLILFFDTFIASDIGSKGGSYHDDRVMRLLSKVRDNIYAYRWQPKINVVKYSLASYKAVDWDKVIIRFECEDPREVADFQSYCKKLFPNALIENSRSATAKHYLEALLNIQCSDDDWVFFSPNNDHPLLSNPGLIKKYISISDEIHKKFSKKDIAILFSHFTESMVDNYITDPQWGYFGFKFKKVIYENQDVIVNFSNKTPLDSIQIFKLGYLKAIFKNTKNTGRVIRLEDTEFCSSKNKNLIQICPKEELCRHYDGYTHLMDKVPPLFIPEGFFEGRIRLRYGYSDWKKGWVNINPLAPFISSTVDMNCLIDDIPSFWADKIIEVDVNPSCNFHPDNILYYKNLRNPWHQRSKALNVLRSLYIYIFFQLYSIMRSLVRTILIKLRIFGYLKKLKSKLIAKKSDEKKFEFKKLTGMVDAE